MNPALCVPPCPLWFMPLRCSRRHRRLAFLLLIPACTRNEVSDTRVATVDSGGIRVTSITAPPSALPQWTLDPVPRRVMTGGETGDETAFAFVGPVRFLSTGGLVIADGASSRLLLYDANGRFVRALGRRGDGPGEMRRLESITVKAGDTLAIFDPGLRRLSFWQPDSGFLRSVNLADDGSLESFPTDAWPWRDSLLVVRQISTTPQDAVPPGSGVRRWPTRAHLVLRGGNGAVVSTSPTFDGMYTGLTARGDIRLPFAYRTFTALAPDRVYFGAGDQFELSWLDAAFRLAGIIRWPSREERLTSAEVDSVRAETVALISRRPLPPDPFAANFAPEVLPESRPSIGRVFVGRDSRIWVERFEAARMGGVQKPGGQWSILQEDGLPIAILRLPAKTRLEDVRGDEVVVVRRDSLDVQTVAVHRLKR